MNWLKNIQINQTLLGIVLLVFGLILAIALAFYLANDLTIWVFGKTVVGEVIQMDYVEVGQNQQGEPLFDYLIVYEFQAASGRSFVGTSPVSATEWGTLGEGSPVLIGYFPLYPRHNRLDNTQYIPVYAVAYVVVGTLSAAGLIGGWSILKATHGGGKEPFWTQTLQRQDSQE